MKGMDKKDSKKGSMEKLNGIPKDNSKSNTDKFATKDTHFKGGVKENYPLG